jgi:Mg-chelatase subunit ChlD
MSFHPFFRIVSIVILLMSVGVSTTFAQTKAFRINFVDFSKFPKMRAYYEAEEVSPDGKERKPLTGLTNADFTLAETINGKGTKNYPVNAITQQCSTKKDGSAVRVVLVLDNSGSMLQPVNEQGLTRWDVIKNGAKSFVQEVDFIDSTAVAILSFETEVKLRQPFTKDVNKLNSAIDAIFPAGNTNYDNPMVDPKIGAIKLLKETLGPPDVRRVIIFLTDGNPSGGILDKGSDIEKAAFLKDVETQMNDNSITFFAVTAFIKMNSYLDRWARATGGRTFEVVEGDPKAQMEEIYRLIAASISKKVTCWLEWTSEYGCNQESRERMVRIAIPKEQLSDDININAPDTTIASVRLSHTGLSFGNPPPNGTQQQTLTLTAEKSDVIISDPVFATTPCGSYRVVSPSLPALIRKGESATFTLEFKQGPNQVYCPSTLVFSGVPCPPPQISLFGGVNSIQLVQPSPTVSSIFSSCEDIEITWDGVQPISKAIRIDYSIDNGANWRNITTNATNGKYVWKSDDLKLLPLGSQFKLKLTEAASSKFLWAKSAGGTLADSMFTIAIGANNDDLFVSGIHRGTINFGSGVSSLTSPHADFSGFVAKYGGVSGTAIWATPMTGTKVLKTYSAACNIKTGAEQRIYATGFFVGDGQFSAQIRNQATDKDRRSMFLVVLRADGSVQTVTDLGYRANAFGEMYGEGVAFDPASNKVYVKGKGRGKVAYIVSTGERIFDFGTSVNANDWRDFTAEFDEQGVLLDVRSGVSGTLRNLWPTASLNASDGNTYSVGTFAGTRKFTGLADVVSAGSTDGFIAKFGVIQGSTSVSTVPFNISVAKLAMLDQSSVFQLGQVAIGNTLDTYIPADKALTNTGNITSKILQVVNSNPTEFKINNTLEGINLKNGDRQGFDFLVSPTGTGQRCANITVIGECSDPVHFTVCVDGLPPCNNFTLRDTTFDNTIIGAKNTKSFTRVFENQTNAIRNIRVSLGNNPNNNFRLVSVTVNTTKVNVTNNTISLPLNPAEKIEAEVEFSPKTVGVDCARLYYATTNPNIICDTTYTQLCGEGIAPLDGRLDNQSWTCQRPNTRLTKNVTFTNIGQIPIRINSASITPPGRFTLLSLPPYPIVAANGGTLDFQVEYQPDDATNHSASMTIEASDENNVTQITRRATLTGNGCEPKISLERECFPTVIIGKSDSKQNAVTIKNDGNFDMNVTNITINPNSEFALTTAFAPFSLTPNETRTIPMQFTPAGIGARTATVTVTSDATETTKTIDICGTGLPEGSVIQMGSIYVCDTKVNPTFEFPTTANPNEDITVTADIINGDQGSFIIEPASQVIPRNTKGTWKITFLPQATGTLATTLRFTTQGLGETQYALTGDATSTSLKLTMSPDKIEPIKIGAPQTFTFAVEAGANISSLNIDDITITLNYEPTMFNYRPNSFTSLANGVTWETPAENKSNGVLSVRGKGVLPSPGNQNIFSLALDVLLGKSLTGTITSAITFPTKYAACLTPITGSQATYKSEEVCFAQGRLVTPGTSITAPEIFPNPTFSTARIDFTVGIDAPASIVIVNQLGETVMTVIDSKLEQGKYSSVVDLSAVSNGLYHIIYTCGPYSFTQVMNVAK